MGWLRRLLGGEPDPPPASRPAAGSQPPPRQAATPSHQASWPAPPPLPPARAPKLPVNERSYSRTDCPTCRVPLKKLPKAKSKCPSCGQAIYVKSGSVDGIRYLLAESELAAFAAAMSAAIDQEQAADLAALKASGYLYGEAWVEVVGESHYQRELERIAGGRREDSVHLVVPALLQREPDNRHDRNAIRVVIEGLTVGYISGDDAEEYQPLLKRLERQGRMAWVRATIVGGWDRGGGDVGSFGVKLDDGLPEPS